MCKFAPQLLSLLLFLMSHTQFASLELVVNVRNQGGEVFQESIWANVTDETVQLKLQQPDGTIITQFIDFKNEIQILNIVLLGEEEQRETPYQILCFVTHFKKADFIPPDAMAKLRQKNPWTVRVPEKDLGKENVTLDVLLDTGFVDWVSPFIKSNCMDAKDGTYAKREELEALVATKTSVNRAMMSQGGNIVGGGGSLNDVNSNNNNNNNNNIEGNSVEAHEQFLRAVKPFPIDPSNPIHQDCASLMDLNKPCLCELEFCIGWYPCALKYCRGRDSGGKPASYRCGIHTCKICRRHLYIVSRKSNCYWLNSY